MSKEEILERINHTSEHIGIISRGALETLVKEVITQTREDTIKEVVKKVYKYLRECEKNRYEYRITATEEIIELINNLKQ